MEDKSLEGWELIRIKGIPLLVHPSWFLILILFTWTAQGQVSNAAQTPLPIWFSWGLGFITALLLFLSVLLHELGHSLVALREGVKVRSITLFLLGGVARVDKECSTPMGALRVAVAGPLVSLFLAIGFLQLANSAGGTSPLLQNLLTQLGSLNLVLALFNLLPGLPLDGGLILKALVWKFTGSQRKGVQVANNAGRFLSIFSIFLGVWICLKGGGFSGFWLIVLGWFGLAASRSQTQMILLQQILTELKVLQACGRAYRVLEADDTLTRLSKLRIASTDDKRVPEWVLVCKSGRWIGYINDQPLKDLPVQNWDNYFVGDFVRPLSELPSIGEKAPLWEAVFALEKTNQGRLLVFNLAGLPAGTLDRIDLGEAVLKKLGMKLPPSFLDAARNQNVYPLGIALPEVVESMISAGLVKRPD